MLASEPYLLISRYVRKRKILHNLLYNRGLSKAMKSILYENFSPFFQRVIEVNK